TDIYEEATDDDTMNFLSSNLDIDSADQSGIINNFIESVGFSSDESTFFGSNRKITQNALKLVINLFNIATDMRIPRNFDSLSRSILNSNNEKIIYEKKWFCCKCSEEIILVHRKQRVCTNCHSRLDIFYLLPLEDQIRRLFKNKKLPVFVQSETSSSDIADVKDGSLYKDFKACFKSHEKNDYQKIYSFILNTDGISISDKSKISIWPLYLAINELPIGERYHINNILIAGILVSNGKPNCYEKFFQSLIPELKSLENGVVINSEIFKFFALFGVFDKPARSMILNIMSSNGKNGCLKCKQEGISLKYKNGSHLVYNYQGNSTLRDHDEYLKDVTIACKLGKTFEGIKGETILSQLECYKPIESTLIDPMHTIFLGVTRLLLQYWFESSFYEKFSLKKFYEKMNNRLKSIRPPNFFTYAPRELDTFKLWRAHEFMNFIFFYSVPLFYEIMPAEYFENFLYLLIGLEQLYSEKIIYRNLKKVDLFFKKFVQGLETLYNEHIMMSGVHELLHLVKSTEDSGPLNDASCFPFEELNRKFTSMINGKDLIGDEFIKLWNISQLIEIHLQDKNFDTEYFKFIKENFKIKTSNSKNNHTDYEKNSLRHGKKINILISNNSDEYSFFFENYSVSPNMSNRQTRDQLTVNNIKKNFQSNSSHKSNSRSHPHSYSTFQKSFKNDKKLENCEDTSIEFSKSNQSYSSENDSPLKNINSNRLRLSSSSSSSNLSPKNLSQIISNRSQPIKSSINITKLNDFTHALVFWSDEDKFSVVSVHAIHTKNGEKITEGQVYKISYGNKLFSGVVKIKGTQKKCQEILDSICLKADEESGYQEKFQRGVFVNKNKNEKQNKVANQLKSLQNENLGLKEKLVKLTEAFNKIQEEKKNLEIDKLSLEEKIKKFQETFSRDEIEKIIFMSKNFLNLFHENIDNVEYIEAFSSEYPEIRVNRITKHSISEFLLKCSDHKGPFFFRKIIMLLIPRISDWTSRTASELKADFKIIINAIFDMVHKQDKFFTSQQMNLKLNTIIQDLKKMSRND
ncbi:hypothetical protein BpHYR1_017555, partial [Brachionus plicatilis]